MKRDAIYILIIVAVGLLYFFDTPDVIVNNQELVDRLKEQNAQLELNVEKLNNDIDSLDQQLKLSETTASRLADDLEQSELELDQIKGKFKELSNDSLRQLMIKEYERTR